MRSGASTKPVTTTVGEPVMFTVHTGLILGSDDCVFVGGRILMARDITPRATDREYGVGRDAGTHAPASAKIVAASSARIGYMIRSTILAGSRGQHVCVTEHLGATLHFSRLWNAGPSRPQ